VSRLTFSTTYATDGVDDGKRATTAVAATTTITETSTTKSVLLCAREDNDTKSTTKVEWEREYVCLSVCD